MKKTGKCIAGMLLVMGMSLAGAVSGFAAPDLGTDLNVENVRWDGDSGSGNLDGQHVSPVLSGEAVPERFFCDEYRIGLR